MHHYLNMKVYSDFALLILTEIHKITNVFLKNIV